MSEITCIIVEDEPLAMKVLSDYISQVSFLTLRAKFKDAVSAAGYLRDNSVDLIFLDIHLPGLKGMAFLKTLINPPAVIITTAYHQYAVEGYELNVVDYLLKPFDFERFLAGVNKVKSRHSSQLDEITHEKDHIFVNVQKKKVRIFFNDILYIESQREYVRIVTVKGDYLTKLSTNEIESLLPEQMFLRVHRSFIVAIKKIESYTSEEIEINRVSIPVGRDYRHGLSKL